MDRVASQPKNKATTHIEGGGGVSCYGQSCTDVSQPSAQPQNHTGDSAKRHHDSQEKSALAGQKNGGGHAWTLRLDTLGRRRTAAASGLALFRRRRSPAKKRIAALAGRKETWTWAGYRCIPADAGRTRSAFRTRRSSLLLRGLSHTRTASRSGASFPSGLRSVGAKNGYPSADGNLVLSLCAARPAFVSVGRVRPDILRHRFPRVKWSVHLARWNTWPAMSVFGAAVWGQSSRRMQPAQWYERGGIWGFFDDHFMSRHNLFNLEFGPVLK